MSKSRVLAMGLGATLALGAVAFPVAAQTEIMKIGYISPEAATDYGWNQQGLIGAQAAAASIGAELIQADNSGYGDPGPVLGQLKDDGAQLIIAQASGYTTVAAQFAKDSGIPVIVFDQPEMTAADLVADVATNSQQGGYLAGVLAAHASKTGVLGIVISADDTNWHKQAGGFVAGAKSVNPEIQILQAQVGPAGYGDAEGGKTTTETLIAGGADIVFGMGDGSSFGMLAAVENATPPAGADKVMFIDVIGDKTPIDAKDVLLSSVLWDFTGTYTQAVADIAAGTFGDAGYTLDAANGGISLLRTDNASDEAWAAVDAAAAGIADGSIEVPLTATQADVDALIAQ